MTTRPWPWDSPAVRKRSTHKSYRARNILTVTAPASLARARLPDEVVRSTS